MKSLIGNLIAVMLGKKLSEVAIVCTFVQIRLFQGYDFVYGLRRKSIVQLGLFAR